MMRIISLLLILLLSAACDGEFAQKQSEGTEQNYTVLDEAMNEAKKQGKPLYVHFTAKWCAPCEKLKKNVYTAPEVAAKLKRFVRAEIDIEATGSKKAIRMYRVQTVPVLAIFASDGKELSELRTSGFIDAEDLVLRLDKALEASNPDTTQR